MKLCVSTVFASTPGNVLLFDCPLEFGVHELAALGHVPVQAPGSGHADLAAQVGARVLLLGGVIFGHVTSDPLLGQGPVGALLAPVRLKIDITINIQLNEITTAYNFQSGTPFWNIFTLKQ